MAKTREVEMNYPGDIKSSGHVVILNPDVEADFTAVKQLRDQDPSQLSEPLMVQVRGSRGNGHFRTETVVGLSIAVDELIPFGSRSGAQKVAEKINNLSETIRRKQ